MFNARNPIPFVAAEKTAKPEYLTALRNCKRANAKSSVTEDNSTKRTSSISPQVLGVWLASKSVQFVVVVVVQSLTRE